MIKWDAAKFVCFFRSFFPFFFEENGALFCNGHGTKQIRCRALIIKVGKRTLSCRLTRLTIDEEKLSE